MEVVEDLKMKVSQLEAEISTLKQKLLLAKNLTPDQNKSKSQKGYSFVEPRIDTGLPYKQGISILELVFKYLVRDSDMLNFLHNWI